MGWPEVRAARPFCAKVVAMRWARGVVAGVVVATLTSCTVLFPAIGAVRAATDADVDDCGSATGSTCKPAPPVAWPSTIFGNLAVGVVLDLAAIGLAVSSLPGAPST